MILSEISVRRPVLAIVMSLLIVLLGTVSYFRLALREYPRIENPVVSVSVNYPGAAAEVMESQITRLLEDNLAGIEGVEIISSVSRRGGSQVSLTFAAARDPESATNDVRDKVSRIRGRLPDGIEEPVIAKTDPDAFPVVWIALSTDRINRLQLSELANTVGRPLLQTAPGVAEVRVFGERRYSMRVQLDPDRMAAYGVTVQDVETALRSNNLEAPAGSVQSRTREWGITAFTSLRTVRDFNLLILRTTQDMPIRLGDVAQVSEAALDENSAVRINGKDAVSLGVIRNATANPVELSQAVRSMLPKLQARLPEGVAVEVANDNSVFIERSIAEVYKTVAEAVLLVCLIIFFFLRSLRASLIPLVTIPISLIGTFAVMAALGYSINTLTLLAMVLAIGLVVDDAIVVLENIHRHMEQGLAPLPAAIRGGREIGFAVVAMTLTLAAVFLPLVFTPGRTGQLFVEFAVALASSVIISGFVSLTLTPSMCARLLRQDTHAGPGRWVVWMQAWDTRLENAYARALHTMLDRTWWVGLALAGVVALVGWAFVNLKTELAPQEDRGVVLVNISPPEGATFQTVSRYLPAIERMAEKMPEVDTVFANASGSGGNVFFRTLPWENRSTSTQELAQTLRPRLAGFAGITATASTPPSLGQGFGSRPLSYVITTTASYQELSGVMRAMEARMRDNPGLQQVDNDLRMNQPHIRLEVDRERAAALGVQAEAISRTLETMMGGRSVTRYQKGSELYDVRLQASTEARNDMGDIERLSVRGAAATVPLASLVSIREDVGPRDLRHFGQRRAATLTANLAPGYTQGQALQFMDNLAKEVLPPGFATDVSGQSREFRTAQGNIALVFGLAILFIFLVLAAQFESFVDPLIILVSVPTSLLGAFAALHATGGSWNIFTQIGAIALVGLVSKHGILIVEFANQLQGQGLGKKQAIAQAARQRLRPILMTASAMILGALPLALSRGAGAESRSQLGWVIVGGLTLGTLLTLLVVPGLYLLLGRRRDPSAHAAATFTEENPPRHIG